MSESMVKRLVGALLGVACALLILFVGFWRTLLIAILAGLGWWLAGSRKIPQEVLDLISRITHLR